MNTEKFPVYFVSHGGGPWPHVEGMRQQFARTARAFAELPLRFPAVPKAVLVISGHWEAHEFMVSTAEHPGMEYDYYGFPEHTYHIRYPAPGSPEIAAHVRSLLGQAGIASGEDPLRGFDHGTFVPLELMYPQANVPIVMLSLKSGYDPLEHIRAGQALAPLREEGVLIMGSGLTYHNMRGFGRDESTPVATAFEKYLQDAISQTDPGTRNRMLIDWESAPGARLAHPREDHLLPLMVVAGAAGGDIGRTLFVDHVMKVPMASYEFGASS
ncbi:class III extradiol ring-cleavage dioxygenase [Oxalobacteraceae bacterium R-40]|uniref:Class III extradiol ring-cleavage dioxygenase n=1 Tax=Keguizhuia sedimenti TaxID=3064264 RepID=A0ABU1BSB9_9BURK|nr:class III extradiol ring-cleavage dioxygenase [Oxalobacteraceae bacterium R-40]